jgi:hypothetical protein
MFKTKNKLTDIGFEEAFLTCFERRGVDVEETVVEILRTNETVFVAARDVEVVILDLGDALEGKQNKIN